MQRHAVISTFNTDPGYLLNYFESYSIYDQSYDAKLSTYLLQEFPDLVKTSNSGHSLSHYLMYIIANYENLAEFVFFLKSNVVPRHSDLLNLEHALDLDGYVPIFHESKFTEKPFIAHYVVPGYFLEINNSWYIDRDSARYFLSYNSFLQFFFVDALESKYVLFTPGGNFGVPKSSILRYPKTFYEALLHLVTYKYFPPESYILERSLFTIFSGKYTLRNPGHSKEMYLSELEALILINLPRKKSVLPKKLMKKIKSKILYEVYRQII